MMLSGCGMGKLQAISSRRYSEWGPVLGMRNCCKSQLRWPALARTPSQSEEQQRVRGSLCRGKGRIGSKGGEHFSQMAAGNFGGNQRNIHESISLVPVPFHPRV